MAIRINGKINVKSVQGRNGAFAVGDLMTSIGEFKVKDAILDQFEDGVYEGMFVIEQIYPASYVWKGRAMVEVRAKLADVIIGHNEPEQHIEEQGEFVPDPIEETQSAPVAPVIQQAQQSDVDSINDENDEIDFLFGNDPEMLAIVRSGGQPITLDPTIDREHFRKQRDYLKSNGYMFDAKAQAWVLKV